MPGRRRCGRAAAVVCAAALAAGCAAAVRRPPAALLTAPVLAVVAWNLHDGRGDVRRLVADLKRDVLQGTPELDYVLLLQEATTGTERDTLEQAASLGLTTYFSPIRRDGGRASGNAILSTLPLDGARAIDLPRERQPRAAAAASIEIAGTRLFVVSTHLENRIGWTRGGLFSEGARGRQADALIRALPADAPGIVGGDMNTWLGPGEPAWRALLERFPDTPGGRPEPTFRDRLVLDHLFFDVPDGWLATRQVIAERYGSDHHPVLGLLYAGHGIATPTFPFPLSGSARAGGR